MSAFPRLFCHFSAAASYSLLNFFVIAGSPKEKKNTRKNTETKSLNKQKKKTVPLYIRIISSRAIRVTSSTSVATSLALRRCRSADQFKAYLPASAVNDVVVVVVVGSSHLNFFRHPIPRAPISGFRFPVSVICKYSLRVFFFFYLYYSFSLFPFCFPCRLLSGAGRALYSPQPP